MQQKPIPEAILFNIEENEHFIQHFAGYLSFSKDFKHIPFILLAKEEKINNINIGIITGVDDIISYTSPVKDIFEKIKLLKKYKNLKNNLPYKTETPQNLNLHTLSLIRRIVDILFTSVLIVLLLPLFLLIALAIKIDSKGSVFYVSPRAGKGYKIFKFYKFRTMVVDADKKIEQMKHLNQYKVSETSGPVFIKIDQDPRVTRVGKFLRNTSLDELPQLINVLIGDMSIVGNRPLPLYEACSLTADETARRFLAPAGITGLWQTKKRGMPDMSVQERIDLDIDYANKNSLLFDIQILLNTPKGLIQKANA